MPIECKLLRDEPEPLKRCPKCGAEPFESFMRGYVQLAGRQLLWERLKAWWHKRLPAYCAIICDKCKEIVGHETVAGKER